MNILESNKNKLNYTYGHLAYTYDGENGTTHFFSGSILTSYPEVNEFRFERNTNDLYSQSLEDTPNESTNKNDKFLY